MNRKGFTLIEVIMVIVIMGLLFLFLIPNVFVLINKNNVKSCNGLINNIESAAKIYVINNKYQLGFSCPDSNSESTKKIELQVLVNSGDLKTDSSGKITNPLNKEEIALNDETDSVGVAITYYCSTNTFKYVVNGITCTK